MELKALAKINTFNIRNKQLLYQIIKFPNIHINEKICCPFINLFLCNHNLMVTIDYVATDKGS